MKYPELGDYLLWRGEPAKIVGQTEHRTVTLELLEGQKCPHCKGDLGKKQITVIPSSPLFQENAKSIPTI